MAPIANLFDSFNDGTIDTSKWLVVSGTWTEPSGFLCQSMPGSGVIESVSTYSLDQSSAFLEVVSSANGAGAASGDSTFRIYSAADPTDDVRIVIDASTGQISFLRVENSVVQETSTISYNSSTMRWIRIREVSDRIYFETSPDGATWTNRFNVPSQPWVDSVVAQVSASQTGGAATTKCFDNFNVAPASSRPVPVGSEFSVSTDGKLGLERCDKLDSTWPHPCSVSAYNALRRSENPCGLWVQPPAKQHLQVVNEIVTVTDGEELTIITLELTNPDTCRAMFFYLPLTARMRITSKKSDDVAVEVWTLGAQVTGVDNSDLSFRALQTDDIGAGFLNTNYVWTGASDYYWTADPGETTTVEVKMRGFSGDGRNTVTQFAARLGIIGMSEIL